MHFVPCKQRRYETVSISNWFRHTVPLNANNIFGKTNTNVTPAEGMTPKDAIYRILQYSTIPGTSRHHWGTDIDMSQTSMHPTKNGS